jgi:formylglycine-generating enzyme required for sulfatase activity
MPRITGSNKMPPLEDTTLLIYDPPGEAFLTENQIVEFASFVKRSKCLLFLIDITSLGQSIASEMAKLLDTYLLGMRRMGIGKESQHMIVVYTKSDDMKVSVPEFEGFLEKHSELRDHLNEQLPKTLANPIDHLSHLERISKLLEGFTRSELNAGRFINEADDWFASVSYTVVSSLGAAPEQRLNEQGKKEARLTVKMSPRGVVDPLLYVLAKSIKIKKLPPVTRITIEPPTQAFPPWVAIAVIVGIIAFIGVLVLLLLWLFGGSDDKPQSNINTPQRASTSPQRAATLSESPTPPSRMTYVPGGEFTMGNAGGDVSERPPHNVVVKPFYLDLYEVTREQYERFVKETGRAPPSNWPNGQYPPGTAQRPVTGVTWYDAVAYATWAGKRLPTEEEWEFAARGTGGYLYPWGNEFKAGMANVDGYSNGLVDVGTFKGVSPFGVYDMIGNAWEWTSSDLRAYPGGSLSEAVPSGMKVIRGGSWQSRPTQATAAFRRGWGATGESDYSNTGFRCAKNLEH